MITMTPGLDLNVRAHNPNDLDQFIGMGRKLDLGGLAVCIQQETPIKTLMDGFRIVKRIEIQGNTLNAMQKQARKLRHRSGIVAVPLRDVDIANWAAKDPRVDLLMPIKPYRERNLRDSTARMAATSRTALELPIYPLLRTTGLSRSKILKAFRGMVRTATRAGMPVLLSSGAPAPLMMRTPLALQCIGRLLGLDAETARNAVMSVPMELVSLNEKRLSDSFIAPGIEIVGREGEQ